jgi:hypothetical protein
MMKRKYNIKLQELPHLTMLFEGSTQIYTDIKNKAPIFEETQLKVFMLGNMESSHRVAASGAAMSEQGITAI